MDIGNRCIGIYSRDSCILKCNCRQILWALQKRIGSNSAWMGRCGRNKWIVFSRWLWLLLCHLMKMVENVEITWFENNWKNVSGSKAIYIYDKKPWKTTLKLNEQRRKFSKNMCNSSVRTEDISRYSTDLAAILVRIISSLFWNTLWNLISPVSSS